MKGMYFSIKYCYSDILLKKNFIYNRLFCCNHICYCVNMVSVTSASRYKVSASLYFPRYQRRSSMYMRGLIPGNFAELAKEVVIVLCMLLLMTYFCDGPWMDIFKVKKSCIFSVWIVLLKHIYVSVQQTIVLEATMLLLSWISFIWYV